MMILEGKSVCGGIAIGKILFFKRGNNEVKRYHTDDMEAEIKRFEQTKATAISELEQIYETALKDVGEANAMIFEIHKMMLEDEDYCDSIINIIKMQSVNADYAIAVTGDNFSNMFSAMEDTYMQARAADVKDITNRLLNILGGVDKTVKATEPVIIAADDLAPSETVQLEKDNVLAFITKHGSSNSHTAILARTMNIPAVIGLDDYLKEEYDGEFAIIDGKLGKVFINPDEETLTEYTTKQREEQEKRRLLQELKGKENVTLSGKKIDIYANIGSINDIGLVLQNDAGGIGLFRSEFLYLEETDYPTEEKQFSVYKKVLESMGGKRVVIRTLDIGADKQIDYFNLPKEENPALGFRAIRICLTRIEIFKTQIRALLRASVFGNLAIMFPMIICSSEVKQILEIVEEVKTELKNDGLPYSENIEFGIMIETPAAAIMSDELAELVDFFSIGSNDLTQYTLAIDRQNPSLEPFCNTKHPAILRLIAMVVENAHKNGIWVGICGELGADLSLTDYFISIGVDELSVSPSFVLPLREKVRQII